MSECLLFVHVYIHRNRNSKGVKHQCNRAVDDKNRMRSDEHLKLDATTKEDCKCVEHVSVIIRDESLFTKLPRHSFSM